MRSIVAIAVLALLVCSASASQVSLRSLGGPQPQGDYCTVCATFMQSQIEELEDIIVQIGIVDGCNSICNLLPNSVEASVCSVLCEYVGVNSFINYINQADLVCLPVLFLVIVTNSLFVQDPLYMCMELGICPKVDNAAGRITSFSTYLLVLCCLPTADPTLNQLSTLLLLSTETRLPSTLNSKSLTLLVLVRSSSRLTPLPLILAKESVREASSINSNPACTNLPSLLTWRVAPTPKSLGPLVYTKSSLLSAKVRLISTSLLSPIVTQSFLLCRILWICSSFQLHFGPTCNHLQDYLLQELG